MMKWYSITLLLLLAWTTQAQHRFQEQIYFDLDESVLTAEAQATLDQLIQEISTFSDYDISLFAHTDSLGSLSYNKILAERRADAVTHYFAQNQVKIGNAKIETYGEEKPTYSNSDELGRSKNRRVDVIVSTTTPLTLESFLEQYQNEQEQHYTIDGTTDVKLIGDQGTALWIAAGALVLEDGSVPTSPIDITMKEAYDYSDMLLNGLSTHASDRLLETGGMVYFNATADGQPLKIKAGTSIPIALPSDEFKQDMALFTGEVDAQHNVTNWAVTKRTFERDMNDILEMRPKPKVPNWRGHTKFYVDETGKPKHRNRPIKPSKPRKPAEDKVRFYPTTWQKLIWSEEKMAQKQKRLYEEAVERYNERVKKYEQRLVQYGKDTVQYAIYQEQLAAWNGEVKKIRAAHYDENQKKFREQYKLYEKALAKWEEERLEKLTRLDNFDAVGKQATNALYNYFSRITDFGWINCDRFMGIPKEEKMQLVVKDQDDISERIFLLFNDSNSILSTRKKGNYYLSNAIPQDAKITIVGLKFKDRQPMLAQLTTQANAKPSYLLDYKPYTIEELKAQLAILNQG